MFISDLVRASGALLGLAIGDAMGAPLEGLPRPGRVVTGMEAGGRYLRAAGSYTDDTLQAAAVAESLVVCRGYRAEDLIMRLISGYRLHPEYYGPTSAAVFDRVMEGFTPYAAAAEVHALNRGSRTNGSVMRGPPLGVYYAGPAVAGVSYCCSRLTHFDTVAASCSAWLNQMVSDMCRGFSREKAFSHALRRCREDEVADFLGRYMRCDPVPGLDALECTHAALTCFMESRDFEAAVVHAVNLGGDADTVGACCGALSGAYFGSGAIPVRWLAPLQDREALSDLAFRLWVASRT